MGHTQGHRADSNPDEDEASDISADILEHAVQWCDASFQIFNRKKNSDELTNISRAKALFLPNKIEIEPILSLYWKACVFYR